MIYACPSCSLGTLKSARITYLRQWGPYMVTLPNFAAWQCDFCGYTRYDGVALARIELLFGPDAESLMAGALRRSRPAEGPDERGPRRWSY